MNPTTRNRSTTGTELSEYNRIAIQNAAKLHEFRTATRQPDRTDLPIEQLVASFNSTAAGVYREYERMGDRPVSKDLEQRAATTASSSNILVSLSARCCTTLT